MSQGPLCLTKVGLNDVMCLLKIRDLTLVILIFALASWYLDRVVFPIFCSTKVNIKHSQLLPLIFFTGNKIFNKIKCWTRLSFNYQKLIKVCKLSVTYQNVVVERRNWSQGGKLFMRWNKMKRVRNTKVTKHTFWSDDSCTEEVFLLCLC